MLYFVDVELNVSVCRVCFCIRLANPRTMIAVNQPFISRRTHTPLARILEQNARYYGECGLLPSAHHNLTRNEILFAFKIEQETHKKCHHLFSSLSFITYHLIFIVLYIYIKTIKSCRNCFIVIFSSSRENFPF